MLLLLIISVPFFIMNDIIAIHAVLRVNIIVVCAVVDRLFCFVLLMLLFSIF